MRKELETAAKTADSVCEQLGKLMVNAQKDMATAMKHKDIADFQKMLDDWPKQLVKEAALEKWTQTPHLSCTMA